MSPTLAPYSKHHPRKTYIRTYRLDELFDDDTLLDKLIIARYRVLMGFDHATQQWHGRPRGTDNYIVGVGGRQSDLVDHIVGMRKPVIAVNDLPRTIGSNTAELRTIAQVADRNLLALCISAMVNECHIWFEEQVPGTWNVLQSEMDEYRNNKRVIAKAKKHDATLRREKLHGGGRLRVVH